MATKMYNSHLSKIMECNEYYILDTYINLVDISSEVNGRYLIQTFTDNISDLINLVLKKLSVSYKTVYNCIQKLITLQILIYDSVLECWSLKDMENMTKSKDDLDFDEKIIATGYTKIRKFFFTSQFSSMKAREKRLIIFMTQLKDSKKSKYYDVFSVNLLKSGSVWMKVLKTKLKYYARATIVSMLNKYSFIFEDNSNEYREQDIAPSKIKSFKFFFGCNAVSQNTDEDTYIDLVLANNAKEYELVKNKASFAEVTLSKKLMMHLVRAIANLKEWFLKERIVQIIINKYRAIQIYKSREKIKSLPAYAAAVVKSVVAEYKNFIKIQNMNKNSYETGEMFNEYSQNEIYDSKKQESLIDNTISKNNNKHSEPLAEFDISALITKNLALL